jgi:hypothetical protein
MVIVPSSQLARWRIPPAMEIIIGRVRARRAVVCRSDFVSNAHFQRERWAASIAKRGPSIQATFMIHGVSRQHEGGS